MAASKLSLSYAYKTSGFSEINPVPPIFFFLPKIFPMEWSSDSLKLEKNNLSDFGLRQFLFLLFLSLLFHFCNIFDLVTSRTLKIAWRLPVFKPDFYILSIMNNSGKCEEIPSTSFYCIIPP